MKSAWRIEIAPRSLAGIVAKNGLREVAEAIDRLALNPERQGKPLAPPFGGLRCTKSARDRYRILYRTDPVHRIVSILLASRRKPGPQNDIYALAQRLLRSLLR